MPKTPPSYTRGKYNVTKQSPKVICPICDQEVYSRGLHGHIRLMHSEKKTFTDEKQTISGLKSTKKVRKKTTNYSVEDILEGLVILGVGSFLINQIAQHIQKKGDTALLVKKPN
jgi:hypothetical protein